MKTFRKLCAVLLCVALMLSTLAGCGAGNEEAKAASETAGNEDAPKEKERPTILEDATAVLDLLATYEYADYQVIRAGEDRSESILYSLRDGGFSVSIDIENELGLQNEILRCVDNVVYFKISEEIAQMYENLLTQEPEAAELAELFGFEVKAGWVTVLEIPEEFQTADYIRKLVASLEKLYVKLGKELKEDGNRLIADSEVNEKEMARILKDYVKEDVLPLCAEVLQDAAKVDYVEYLENILKENESAISELASRYLGMGQGLSVEDIMAMLLQEVDVESETALKDLIREKIQSVDLGTMEEEIENMTATLEEEILKIQQEFVVTCTDGVISVTAKSQDTEIQFVVTPASDKLEVPEVTSYLGGSAAGVLFLMVVPSMYRYVEKAKQAREKLDQQNYE